MAEILGIDKSRVEQAFKQAASETWDERMKNHLARLVETGKITQEQANHKSEWMKENSGLWKKNSRFGNPHDKHGHWKGHRDRMK
jgi:SOS response regulatory protein OraA/RecX